MTGPTLTLLVCGLLAAAAIDARRSRYPNGLAAFNAACACALAASSTGARGLMHRCALAAAACLALTCLEAAWRAARGERGLGGGDIKYLAAVLVAHPFAGAASFACGLAALAASPQRPAGARFRCSPSACPRSSSCSPSARCGRAEALCPIIERSDPRGGSPWKHTSPPAAGLRARGP